MLLIKPVRTSRYNYINQTRTVFVDHSLQFITIQDVSTVF